jgi:predicted Ser/Thr protein kinase
MQGGDMNTMKKCSTCSQLYAGDLCPTCMAGFAQQPSGPAPAQTELPLKPGQSFHGLEILEVLGRGGMGIVYKARQPALDRLVALKILPLGLAQDPDFQNRFIREAKALGSLNHPNIVAVYDFGSENGLFFFAMEFVDGTNLRSLLRDARFTPEQALKIVPQLCDALEYAHTEGVVHRDIKPENILLDRKGRVKIADFGLAKLVGADAPVNLTVTNMVMGTPHYMAPEQVENPKSVDHRADIYAIGVVFYEMLTGELPIGRFDLPSKKVQIDVRLDEVVLKTLEKRPTARYQKAGDVKDAVTKATTTASRESYAPTVMTPRPAARPPFMSPVAITAAAAVVLLVLFVALRPKLPATPSLPATAVVPAVPAPVDLTRVHFGPDERPARYVYAPTDKSLPRNPFPALDEAEIGQLCRLLDEIGLQNVSPREIRQGYLAAWFRWNAAFVALDTPVAERLERQFMSLKNLSNKWTHRRDSLLVMAWAPRTDSRQVFHALVGLLQAKLGLPAVTPDVPLANLKVDRSDLPSHWQFQEPAPPIAGRAGLLEQVQASFVPEEGDGQIEVRAWLADTPESASAFEAAKLDFKDRRKVDILRAGRSVAGVALRGEEFGAYAKTLMRLRTAMGLPQRTFDSIRPAATELPAGYSVEREETQPARVLQELGIQGILASEVRRAVLLRIKPAGMIAVFETAEAGPRAKLEEQLRQSRPGWSDDGLVVAVDGPDDETLDALENRMREFFGWDRNRPRSIGLGHARLKESELPEGWSLGPAGSDRWSYAGTLVGPSAKLGYEIVETRDYRVLEEKAAALQARAGDLVLVKDTVICAVWGGGEASWPVLDRLETVLRRKMRMGPPSIAELGLARRELPEGTSMIPRKDAGFPSNPLELKGAPALRRQLDARLGASLDGAVAAWTALIDPAETLVAVLQAPDAAGAAALAELLRRAKGARHAEVFVRDAFVAVVRSERQDDGEFRKIAETVRAKLRLAK